MKVYKTLKEFIDSGDEIPVNTSIRIEDRNLGLRCIEFIKGLVDSNCNLCSINTECIGKVKCKYGLTRILHNSILTEKITDRKDKRNVYFQWE